jgi:archaellum component FlaC
VPSESELEQELHRLEEEEREVSDLRKKLHERLASFPNPVVEQQERELSARRRELHDQIDRLRIRLRDGDS